MILDAIIINFNRDTVSHISKAYRVESTTAKDKCAFNLGAIPTHTAEFKN